MEDQWKWIESNPKARQYFLNKGIAFERQFSKTSQVSKTSLEELKKFAEPGELVAFLNKIKDFEFLKQPLYQGNTVLHFLSQAPLDEAQMSLVAHFLKMGVKPGHKNESKMTFLNLSPIKSRLCQKIEQADDPWCSGIFEGWQCDIDMLQR